MNGDGPYRFMFDVMYPFNKVIEGPFKPTIQEALVALLQQEGTPK